MEVIAEYVGVPFLILGIIGAASGILKRRTSTMFLIVWAGFVFVFFSSLPGTWPRVILPLTPPLAILEAQGIITCEKAVARLLSNRTMNFGWKMRFDVSLKACFVIVLVLVNLYCSIPAITNTHSAYREAADFIAANVPNGNFVFYVGQPVLLLYFHDLYKFGKYAVIVSDIGSMNASYAVVLDFLAKLSPYYPQIESHVAQMRLVANFTDATPTINMLDSMSFSRLHQLEPDPDLTNILIYFRSSTKLVNSQSNPPASPALTQCLAYEPRSAFKDNSLRLGNTVQCSMQSLPFPKWVRITWFRGCY